MKTVVITGNARGFGYEMTKLFREKNYNVVLCDINETELNNATGNSHVNNKITTAVAGEFRRGLVRNSK